MPIANPLGRLLDVAVAFAPADTQTAQTSDVVSLKNAAGCLVLFIKNAGVAGDDPVLTFQQATSVAEGGIKNLATVTKFWQKQGTLSAVTAWSKVTQAASQTVSLDATSAESQGIYAFFVDAADLDVNNGFDCIKVSVGDTGNAGAQLGTVVYLPVGLAYPSAPESLPNPLAD